MKQSISVVIPTFNRASLIENTIISCIKQTLAPEEIIVVDDQSTDNTRLIVEKINHEHINIRFISLKQKGGAQAARNEGIKQATCDWIAFNDSDDEWLPNKLEQQVNALARNDFDPYTVVHGNCIVRNHDSGKESIWDLPKAEGVKPLKHLLQHSSVLFPNILTSKQALVEIGYLDENVPSYQEWDTALLLSKLCFFVHIEEPLFVYHLHKGETISKNLVRDITGFHYILMKYRKDIVTQLGDQFFVNAILANIKRVIASKEWNCGVKLLKDARPYIPVKSFLYYKSCFSLRINPDSIRAPLRQ